MASKAATRCSLHLLLSLVLAVVLLASCSSADNASPRDWTVETFPDPQHQPEACGRPGVALSRVCDPDGLLNEKSKDIIEGLIIKVDEGSEPYAKRKCGGEEKGFEIGVVIMAGFASNHGELPAHAAARMARGIHDKWGVGSGTCNNGLLLLASLRERQIYISTGSGANNHLSNSATDNGEANLYLHGIWRQPTFVKFSIGQLNIANASSHASRQQPPTRNRHGRPRPLIKPHAPTSNNPTAPTPTPHEHQPTRHEEDHHNAPNATHRATTNAAALPRRRPKNPANARRPRQAATPGAPIASTPPNRAHKPPDSPTSNHQTRTRRAHGPGANHRRLPRATTIAPKARPSPPRTTNSPTQEIQHTRNARAPRPRATTDSTTSNHQRAHRLRATPKITTTRARANQPTRPSHGEALESAVHHLGLFLAEDAAKPGSWAWFKDMIPLLVFIPVVGMLFFGSKQQTTYNDCMKKLKKLKEDQDVLRAEGKFQSVNCPICFEDFDKPVGEDRDELQPKEGVLSVINGEAGPSGSAADKKGKAKEEAKAGKTVKPLVLPCGHAFCFPCIAEWVQQKKTQCPICRDPIDDSTPRPTRPPPAPCTAGAQATAGAQGAATATAAGAGGSSSTYTQDAPADPTDEADPFQMGAEGEGSNAHRQAFPRRGWRERRQDQLNAELLFRLMTLRNRYPRYITPEMHAGWQHDIQTGWQHDIQTGELCVLYGMAPVQARDPAKSVPSVHQS
eukprot:gene20928-27777_t